MEMGSSDQQVPQPGWQFTADGSTPVSEQQMSPTQAPQQPAASGISWTASEFVAHHKSAGWYGILFGGTAVVVGLIYLLTKDLIAVVMISLIAIAFAVAAARKPRTLQYSISNDGLQIGQKHYSFREFKAFSVVDDEGINFIDLMPLKRFLPAISIYYDPKDESQIAELLSDHLPFQPAQRDTIDRFLHKIRF